MRAHCNRKVTVDGEDLVCLGPDAEEIRYNFPPHPTRWSGPERAPEAQERAAVLMEAYTWVGTPYHHLGRHKLHGVDCATLVAEVYEKTGIVPRVDIAWYPMDWNLHQGTERYLAYVHKYATEIKPDEVIPGDMVMFKWGRSFAHGAIIADPGYPYIVHADRTAGEVTYSDCVTGSFVRRDRLFYRPNRWVRQW